MKISYSNINLKNAAWLTARGYDMVMDADRRAVVLIRGWPTESTVKCLDDTREDGDVLIKDVRKNEGDII